MTSPALPAIPRPPPGLLTLSSRLAQLSVVTWALPPARLRPLLPPHLPPDLLHGAALLSAVTFCNQDFRLAWMPRALPGLTLGQTNYRVYVQDPDGLEAVFFLGTTIDTPFVFVPRRLWGMPWRHARYRFQQAPDTDTRTAEAQGEWPMHLRLSDCQAPLTALAGFPSLAAGLTRLTQPWVGHYPRGRYTVWHAPYVPRAATLVEARFPLLEQLGLLSHAEQQAPHSVITAAEDPDYLIYLPPGPPR